MRGLVFGFLLMGILIPCATWGAIGALDGYWQGTLSVPGGALRLGSELALRQTPPLSPRRYHQYTICKGNGRRSPGHH
jgi:hypothetical protein